MTRGTRGSSFNNKTSGLERAKDQNPFGAGGRGFSLPANYKQTEADAFEDQVQKFLITINLAKMLQLNLKKEMEKDF
tara:strand:+ start:24 stop:254 length:231 start_codon:yes stop_codon:yes gene_type:complete